MTRYMWQYLKEQKLQLVILGTITVIALITTVIGPYINGMFIDTIITFPTYGNIIYFALLLGTVGISGTIFTYIAKIVSVKFINTIDFRITSTLINHMQRVPLENYITKFNPSQLIQRINVDSNTIISFYASTMFQIVLNIVLFIWVSIMLFSISVPVLVLTLIFIPLYLLSYIFMKNTLYESSKKVKEESNIYFKKLFEQLSQIHTIKVDASFNGSYHKMLMSFKNYIRYLMKNTKIIQAFSSIDTIISIGFQIGVLFVGGMQIIEGKMTIGQYTIVNSYFNMLLGIVKYYFGLGKSYQEAKASYQRIKELVNLEEEINGTLIKSSINTIETDSISFYYKDNVPILNQINRHSILKKGNIYCLRGPNGTGKTTLIYIIIGVIQNLTIGSVMYDGINTSDIDLYNARRNRISVLLQNPTHPDETVAEYLISSTSLQIQQICEIAKDIGFDSVLSGNGFDLENHLEQKMEELSGGELQKIYLLKTFTKDADVLILDEPVTALDAMSIESLIKFLKSFKKDYIIIMTNHDTRLDGLADEIIAM